MTYHSVAAAESLMVGASKGAWILADALVVDIPERVQGRGGNLVSGDQISNPLMTVRDELTNVAIALEENGILTPNGDPYSVDRLQVLRATAIAWPEDERHVEAAFRTHQEVGSPQRRIVLEALCRYANGEKIPNPDPSWVDDDAFDNACQMVEAQVARGRGYQVSANAVRTAMQRKPNVNKPPSTVFEMLEKLSTVANQMGDFQKLMNDNGVGLSPEERDALMRGVTTLIMQMQSMLIQVTGVSDDDIRELIEGERDGHM
jgi:hypothetical protein